MLGGTLVGYDAAESGRRLKWIRRAWKGIPPTCQPDDRTGGDGAAQRAPATEGNEVGVGRGTGA
jgi:hypothetical protein